jgi:hypothetical protein
VLPLFGGPSREPPDGDRELLRFESVTGLKRGDLREMVFARGSTRDEWVLVLSGLFPRGVAASTIATALGASGAPWTIGDEGRAAVRSDSGLAVSRTDDGAVLVGSSTTEIERARARSNAGSALGLELQGPGGFGLGQAALHELARDPRVVAEGTLPADLESLSRVHGLVTLGDRISLAVTFEGPDRAAAQRAAERILEMLKAFGRQGETAGASLCRRIGERAAIRPGGGPEVVLDLALEREELARALELFADRIRAGYTGPE